MLRDAVGIDEDGHRRAHCSLAPWSGVLRKTRFLAWQASARGGELQVALQGDRVRLAGYAVTVLKGGTDGAGLPWRLRIAG
jgi:hypothetical protein